MQLPANQDHILKKLYINDSHNPETYIDKLIKKATRGIFSATYVDKRKGTTPLPFIIQSNAFIFESSHGEFFKEFS